ncbi:hypothetical protein X975_26515, partial [Stegodyphus mimosarum]
MISEMMSCNEAFIAYKTFERTFTSMPHPMPCKMRSVSGTIEAHITEKCSIFVSKFLQVY